VRLKGFRGRKLLFHCFGPGIANSPEQNGIICDVGKSRSETLIDKIDIESQIVAKAAPSLPNNSRDFRTSRQAFTKKTKQLHFQVN
jgi:hypothetical protein